MEEMAGECRMESEENFAQEMEGDLSRYASDSNSSNSPSLSEEEEVDEGKITELQEQITTSPFNYDPHVQLITLLRKTGDLLRLREAREKMSTIFPLTPELWMDWLTDELKLAATEAEKDAVTQLFERAVKDYMSVSVWLEYCQFSIEKMRMKDGLSKVREVCERALTAVGLHVIQGSMIWEAFREFELAILGTLQPPGSVSTPEQLEKINEQNNRILTLFKRQLSVPLYDMERTYEELQEWTNNEIDNAVKHLYQKAKAKLQKLQPYEEALLTSETPHLDEYLRYIAFEEKEGDPTRIQCIYERALVENCLQTDLWQKYLKYLDTQLKIGSVALPVHERAVRNCPWCAALWINYIRALERHNESHEKITGVVEKALQAGFSQGEEFRQLWLTYLDYLRRRIKWEEEHNKELEELLTTFQRAVNHMNSYFSADGDPTCSILQYWAKIEAKFCKNITRAREIWNDILNQGHASEAHMWLELANLERSYGDIKHCRRALLRGLQSANDWPETVGEALISFEREEGTLETLDAAMEKYEIQMERVQQRRQKLADKEAEKKKHQAEQKKQAKAEKKAQKLASLKGTSSQTQQSEQPEQVAEEIKMDSEGFKIPPPPTRGEQNKSPVPTKSKRISIDDDYSPVKRLKTETDNPNHGVTVPHDSSKDNRTVFLSNLSYEIEESRIREVFSEVGEITDLRLVRDYRGRSKGYGYLEFSTQAQALSALEKDRIPLDGRPVFISPCEDKRNSSSRRSKFKFNSGLEKNKLFIKGLPYETTAEELEDLFKQYGTIRQVRLVTYRNGHSKGIAYVEFESEVDAATALVKSDGMTVGKQTISVAISNPPERKQRRDISSENIVEWSSSLGSGSGPGPRGRGRTQVSLLPRALQRSQTTKTPSAIGSKSVQNGEQARTGTSEREPEKKLSNEDFRSLLMK